MLEIDKIARIDPATTPAKMEKELSGVMIILIIGGGVLTFIILFLFAKRQIMRFTLRSRRGPHVPVGHDATKSIKKEIERRLDCIQQIVFEPELIEHDLCYIVQTDAHTLPPYYYRLKAVDDMKVLEREIAKQDATQRQPRDSIRAFLLTTLAAPTNGSGQRLIQQFCDMYEHARHDPSEFRAEEYEAYRRLLLKLLDAAKSLRTYSSSRKSSPSRTPQKKPTKIPSLLDPSRLRPPPTGLSSSTGNIDNVLGTNSRINYGLGLQSQNRAESEHQALGKSQSPPQNVTLHLDANEIISVSAESNVI